MVEAAAVPGGAGAAAIARPRARRDLVGSAAGTRLRRRHVHRLVLASDVVGGSLAAAVCMSASEGSAGGVRDRLVLLAVVFAAVVGVLVARGSRRSRLAPRVADDLGFIISSLAVAGLVLFALRSVPALGTAIRPSSIGIALGAGALCVPLAREVGAVLAARNPANVARVVVVGSGFIAGYLTARLSRSPLVDVLGIVDDRPGGDQRVLGRFEDLPRLCQSLDVDRVVIAFSERHPARTADVVQAVRSQAEVDVVVRFFEITGWNSTLSDVTGLPVLRLGAPPGRAGRAAKRAIDIAVSSACLTVLSPLLLLVAVAVRAESSGPVLFRQERVGRDQSRFRILKFRTMRPELGQPSDAPAAADAAAAETSVGTLAADAPAVGTAVAETAGLGTLQAVRRDGVVRNGSGAGVRTPFDTVPDPARITRIGTVLRRSGLDELPQLINVLRGEMSLVGPRPFIPEECDALSGPVARRFDVRPGMTGMWQVCGQHELTFEELVRLDVQYATGWSLRSDLRILARTPGRLLRGSAPDR